MHHLGRENSGRQSCVSPSDSADEASVAPVRGRWPQWGAVVASSVVLFVVICIGGHRRATALMCAHGRGGGQFAQLVPRTMRIVVPSAFASATIDARRARRRRSRPSVHP